MPSCWNFLEKILHIFLKRKVHSSFIPNVYTHTHIYIQSSIFIIRTTGGFSLFLILSIIMLKNIYVNFMINFGRLMMEKKRGKNVHRAQTFEQQWAWLALFGPKRPIVCSREWKPSQKMLHPQPKNAGGTMELLEFYSYIYYAFLSIPSRQSIEEFDLHYSIVAPEF